jgi:membrane-bound lytic murein transglycosylase MltF
MRNTRNGRDLVSRLRGPLFSTLTFVAFAGGSLWSQQIAVSHESQVDALFSALHQNLDTTAKEILSSAARSADKPSWQSTQQLNGGDSFARTVTNGQHAGRYERAIERVQALRPLIEPILQQEDVPQELAAVVLVESGGQPAAVSRKGARGLWQLMPETAKRYGLIVSPQLDERIDVERSTRAASRYLRDLYSQFGDWPLVLAAYNAGAERVAATLVPATRRAIGYSNALSRLPMETQQYVPAVLKAVELINGGNRTSRQRPFGNSRKPYATAAVEN